MKRLDWWLIRPDRCGAVGESLRMAQLIRRLVGREASGEPLDEYQVLLGQLETTYMDGTVAACSAVEAPVIEDDPRWESRLIDDYAESEVDVDIEDYLEMRRRAPDCERCPYASPYSLYPMDPCEFSAGAFEQIIDDRALLDRIGAPMEPDAMNALATDLERVLADKRWRAIDALDAEDYLDKAILFLRFWAERRFGILPSDIDEIFDALSDEPLTEFEGSGALDPPIFH